MSKSIAVFGAGPGLGQAVARHYAREGYAVTLVGRRPEPLDRLAKELASAGATAHVVTADLADTGATPRLAEEIRAKTGPLDAFYYAPTPATATAMRKKMWRKYRVRDIRHSDASTQRSMRGLCLSGKAPALALLSSRRGLGYRGLGSGAERA